MDEACEELYSKLNACAKKLQHSKVLKVADESKFIHRPENMVQGLQYRVLTTKNSYPQYEAPTQSH